MKKTVTTIVITFLIVIVVAVAIDVSITTDREEVLEVLRAAENAVAGADARKFEALISNDFRTSKIGKKELMAAVEPAMAGTDRIIIRMIDYEIEVNVNSATADVVVRTDEFGIVDGKRGAEKDLKWRVSLKRASDSAPWLICDLKLVDKGGLTIHPFLENLVE